MAVKDVEGERRWAIALLASRSSAVLLENALQSIAQCKLPMRLVVVGVPAGEAAHIAPLVTKFGARLVPLADSVPAPERKLQSDDYLLFGTASFNRFMAHKFSLIRALLDEGQHVVYSDVDVAWLRNPLPYLQQVLERYPCAAQTEAVGIFPPMYCAGFMAFAPVARSIRIVDHLIEHIVASAAQNYAAADQEILRELVVNDAGLLSSIFPLPEGLFANGLLDRSVCLRDRMNPIMASVLKPYVFHANWTIGLENKRALLREANAWFVKDERVTEDSSHLASLS